MFSFIKQVFIVLLSFSSSLARDRTKYLSLNDEPCMIMPPLIDLNPVELKCKESSNKINPKKMCSEKKRHKC